MAETTTPNNGWIKLYRELSDKPIWYLSSPEHKVILITLLLMANHAHNEWEWKGKRFICEPGQMITSLDQIAKTAGKGISVQNIRTALDRFERYNFLTNESTKTGRLITICNWATYQQNENTTNKDANKELTKSQQRANKELTSNKNDKNDKNDISIKRESVNDWKKSFEEYKKQVRKAFIEAIQDKTWMQKQQEYYPNVNIKKSLEKACFNYWATEAGWHNKRSKRTKVINWKTTFGNALAMKENHVYNEKFSFNNEKEPAPGIEI
jgi:hypothetical protein